jgi:hypothetical protein
MVPLSSYAGTCYASPSIIITHVDTSYADPSVGATRAITPYIDSSRIWYGGEVGRIFD